MRVEVVLFVLCLIVGTAVGAGCEELNGCSSHGQCIEDKCVCHDGWGFEDCSLTTTNCTNNCFGHGQCLNGTCECDSGFGGEACDHVTQSCPNNCTGHGMCHNGACVCFPGFWTGEACDVEIYKCPEGLNHCNGNGECGPVDWQDEASPWECTCQKGFCGASCDTVCGNCPNNCTGHGTCVDGEECACHVGFTGADCSFVAPIATCPNNCTGRGACGQVNGTGAYRCICSDCYMGNDCSKTPFFCPGNCSGRGFCDCQGKCVCQSGYEGVACETVQATCDALNFCSGNGDCVNGTCHCLPGFAGPTCSLACHTGGGNSTIGCHAPMRGRCIASGNNATAACVCKPEYTGVGCQEKTTEGVFDEYVNGWNPIGTIVLLMVSATIILVVGGMAYNYSQGKRGMNAMPGINSMRSKVKEGDFEAMEGSRNETNY